MGAADEGLVKVFLELHDAPFETESFWAKPLGGDLYELRNSPWYAFDLHFYDIVRAIPDQPDEKPRIVGVVRRSGHKTLRVLFPPEVAEPERLEMLRSLHHWRGFHESCNGTFTPSMSSRTGITGRSAISCGRGSKRAGCTTRQAPPARSRKPNKRSATLSLSERSACKTIS